MQMDTQTSENRPNNKQWDVLLSKYVSVWIWSIIFGSTTGLVYSFSGMVNPERWSQLNTLLLGWYLMGTMSTVSSLFYLYFYLTRSIIPQFLIVNVDERKRAVNEPSASKRDQEYISYRSRRNAALLAKAILMLVVATAARLCYSMTELLYSSLHR